METVRNGNRAGRQIVVCADDFGMNAAVDAGIVELARLGRLSAVSCMSLGPTFTRHAAALAELPVDKGLHLNFTEALGQPGLYLPLSQLILRAYLRSLDPAVLAQQIQQQLDAFEASFGQAPDYVDGHQHVHQLPQIRDSLLTVLNQRYGAQRPWLRSTRAAASVELPAAYRRKGQLIAALGSRGLARLAARHGYAMNRCLLGVYDFQPQPLAYEGLLARWLAAARTGDLLMCHPAWDDQPDEGMARQRVREFEAMRSDGYLQLLVQHDVAVARFGAAAQGLA